MAKTRKKERHHQNESESRLTRSNLIWGGAIVAILAVAVAVAISHFGSGGAPAAGQTAAQSAPTDIAAPDFEFTVYQGGERLGVSGEEGQFSNLFGQGQPVVLNFWAGLCPPCRAEMPAFQAVYDARGDKFVMLGLDVGPFVHLGSREDGRALLNNLDVTYPAATTFQSDIVSKYSVRSMPTTVFLTPDGEIYDTHAGLLTENSLREKVDELLQASQGS